MSAIDQLVDLARRYSDATGLEPKTVSWRAFGDTKKLAALETGADIQVGRYERTLQWFSDNWPAEVEWPADIARPPVRATTAGEAA